ncbi:hypothetical protein CTAM01_10308 [Colletotrichum tamarilloi]|uniref:SnoaL-like domain-containing protein n=1 Tax=Colletotrichum tamarilloi TaxID=1209934 RepID=A0ABQ9R0U3_9PEZI|nr:uncharacterized protein CTAM01_10308 [Colletotrichum tamarilloi]KAK1491582.1 hypothetical protein CTAM01_10308 [Colletotrichum tamarilloi]
MDNYNFHTSETVDMVRWIQEMKGESSDRPFRDMQQKLADELMTALEDNDLEAAAELCAPNVRLIGNLEDPGQIFEGLDEIRGYCDQYHGHAYELTTIADRYRVTRIIEFHENNRSQLRAIILDMNDEFKFVRIEMRPLGPEKRAELNKPSVVPFPADNAL